MDWKNKVVVAGSAIILAGTGFWVVKNGKILWPLPYYTVARVIDGDTFVTTEKQYVRLSSTYAPELEFCGGLEAKQALEKLVLNKKVYLKVLYHDTYQRLISLVYTPDGYINEKMIQSGMAYYFQKNDQGIRELDLADKTARASKIGIYSSTCTQETNPGDLKCNIKGNVVQDRKTYHYPGCRSYNISLVQLYLGDRWFCTEKQAQVAGFTKGGDCAK